MKKNSFYTLDDYIITKEGIVINKHNNHVLKPQKNDKGYLRVIIGHKRYFVHRLVAEKYVKKIDGKNQVNHKDGNKLNNKYENLEWVNNLENRKHAVKNNLHLCGEKCSWSKLKEKDVIYIIQNPSISTKELSKQFDVSYSTISDIKKRKNMETIKKIC